jgi:hypothetical protein
VLLFFLYTLTNYFNNTYISDIVVLTFDFCNQEIIRKYTELSGSGNKHAALASSLGSLTWGKPLYSEFQQLARYLFVCVYAAVEAHLSAKDNMTVKGSRTTIKLYKILI